MLPPEKVKSLIICYSVTLPPAGGATFFYYVTVLPPAEGETFFSMLQCYPPENHNL